MRILHVANLGAGPGSAGRAELAAAGEAYAAAGHQLVALVPGAHDRMEDVGATRLVTLVAPRLPGADGQRILLDRPAVREVLTRVRPERVEVSGASLTSLIWLGQEARRRGIASLAICSDSVDTLLRAHLTRALPAWAARAMADATNRRLTAHFDTVVCTTAVAEAEFARIGAAHVLALPEDGGAAAFRYLTAEHVVRRPHLTGTPVTVPVG